jgi:hypothetical protein
MTHSLRLVAVRRVERQEVRVAECGRYDLHKDLMRLRLGHRHLIEMYLLIPRIKPTQLSVAHVLYFSIHSLPIKGDGVYLHTVVPSWWP